MFLNAALGSLACDSLRCCAGDKLRICGAELESHAAGNPLHACNTARLKICRNNTFRRDRSKQHNIALEAETLHVCSSSVEDQRLLL